MDVEGAPCTAPGETADCPSGQACGNDLRCSARAAECAATRCDVGAASCAGAAGNGAGSEFVKRCTAADPVCGLWELVACASRGFECRTDGGSPACECPPNAGTDFFADPLGSGAAAPPHATGLENPRECRFRSLGDALAAAAAVGGAATVHVLGDPGPIVFGDVATGEAFPLDVGSNVALHGAAAPSGPTVIRAESASASDVVALRGAMHGIRVETAAATGTGISISCATAASPPPSLTDVEVDGGSKLTAGIAVTGSCGAILSGVGVARVAGPALKVDVGAAVPVSVAGCTFETSAIGIRSTGGKLTIGPDATTGEPTRVRQNAGEGIVFTGSTAVDVALDHVTVEGNGGTGVVLESTVASVAALTFASCDVHSNGGASARFYGPEPRRQAGGILLARPAVPTSFSFKANRVYANAADGLAIESSATSWVVGPAACGVDSNAFSCVANGAYAVGIGGTGRVDASFNDWSPTPPLVSQGVDASRYCSGATPSCPP